MTRYRSQGRNAEDCLLATDYTTHDEVAASFVGSSSYCMNRHRSFAIGRGRRYPLWSASFAADITAAPLSRTPASTTEVKSEKPLCLLVAIVRSSSTPQIVHRAQLQGCTNSSHRTSRIEPAIVVCAALDTLRRSTFSRKFYPGLLSMSWTRTSSTCFPGGRRMSRFFATEIYILQSTVERRLILRITASVAACVAAGNDALYP